MRWQRKGSLRERNQDETTAFVEFVLWFVAWRSRLWADGLFPRSQNLII
ncbi:MAG: hypothetical protein ACUVTP_03130 [Candidatus Fervidibacter sp.]